MNRLIKGITYAYHRNIGWQDRTIRTIIGVLATLGAIYYFQTNVLASTLLGIFAIAQFGTVISARCILCYFAGRCTINKKEQESLLSKGILFENVQKSN